MQLQSGRGTNRLYRFNHQSKSLIFTLYYSFINLFVSASLGTWTSLKTGTYYFGTETITWYEGRDLCKSLDGHLVEIGSKEEQDTIATYLKTSRSLSSKSFWIGLNSLKKKGEWVWHNSEPAQYVNWYGGLPPPSRIPAKKTCVRIFKAKGGSFAFQWYNDYCSTYRNPLCEKGARSNTYLA